MAPSYPDLNEIEKQMNVLYILVHPLFYKFSCRPEKQYVKSLKVLLRSNPTLLVCVEKCRLKETKEFISAVSQNLQPHFVITEFSKAHPIKGWEYFYKIVSDFKPDTIIIGGAQLSGDKKSGYSNCVGFTYNVLKQRFSKVQLNFKTCYKV